MQADYRPMRKSVGSVILHVYTALVNSIHPLLVNSGVEMMLQPSDIQGCRNPTEVRLAIHTLDCPSTILDSEVHPHSNTHTAYIALRRQQPPAFPPNLLVQESRRRLTTKSNYFKASAKDC